MNLLVLIVKYIKERKLFQIKKIKTEEFWAKQELFVVQELLTEQDKELVPEKVVSYEKNETDQGILCVLFFFFYSWSKAGNETER